MFDINLLPESRCNICIDPSKGCKGECDCKNCMHQAECNKRLSPTVRMTTKCTQKCNHCCFSCSPDSSEFMTMESAVKINQFLTSNNIINVNLMGGEFFCHPEWYDIISTLIQGVDYYVRIVTNADWASNKKNIKRVLNLAANHHQIYFAISKDQWHTNKHVDKAVDILTENDVHHVVGTMEEDAVVPMGNGKFLYSKYTAFMTECSNPDSKYSFLIDEEGMIYKCGYGVWSYDFVDDFVEGGFDERFKQFNTAFYKAFQGSCTNCIRGFNRIGKEKIKEKMSEGSKLRGWK